MVLGPVEVVDETDSTNAELLRRAAAGAAGGLVLVARHQTAGRGRRDRRWEAEPGSSLLVSVLLRPVLAAADLHLLTFAAGLAAIEACEAEGATGVALKWPNDVVVDGPDGARKLAGLLAESTVGAGVVDAVVVGMGLNVRWRSEVPSGGIALDQLVGHDVDVDGVLDRWLAAYGARCEALATEAGRAAVRAEHRSRCATLGRDVRVETTDGAVTGLAVAVDDAGRLVLADGSVHSVGDVVHLRDVSGPSAPGRL